MKKTDIINEIFEEYLVAKTLCERYKTEEYWKGSEQQAWHLILSLGLADKYSEWEKEKEKHYRDSCLWHK